MTLALRYMLTINQFLQADASTKSEKALRKIDIMKYTEPELSASFGSI